MAKFKRCYTNIFDNEHPGRLKTGIIEEGIAKVHEIVIDDHRLTVIEIADAARKVLVKVFLDSCGIILNDYFKKVKTINSEI